MTAGNIDLGDSITFVKATLTGFTNLAAYVTSQVVLRASSNLIIDLVVYYY